MTKFRVFVGIIGLLALAALFAAGQLFQLLPRPDIVFFGSIAVIVCLLIGYWFALRKSDNDGN